MTNLPVPEFTTLVGVQKYYDQLSKCFDNPDGPTFVSLEGLGGIGKSALARGFIGLQETTLRWPKIIWVSARQTVLTDDGQLTPVTDPATTLEDITTRLCEPLGLIDTTANSLERRLEGIRNALAREKFLIIVDNLETVDEYSRLVPTFATLAGISRFLITTRQTLREFPFVHAISLKELDKKNAFSLLESEITRRGRVNPITKEDFSHLYPIVGGHPLALKLTAAQLFLRPLSEIMMGFKQASGKMDQLYRYLYWQTWNALSDPARKLLLSFLPSDPEGEDIEFLQLMSGQESEDFFAALKELDQTSILEVSGSAEFTLYRLHSLTITFLQTDILSLWTDAPAYE